MTMLAISVRL